jgi:drug/metabolite transporter (DMT)-like permease
MELAVITSTGSRLQRRIPSVAAVCALLSAACWGFGIVASKGALDAGITPLTLISIQLTTSVVVLTAAALLLVRRVIWPDFVGVRRAAASGILEYGATYALAAFGLALTTAGNAAIIGTAEPALVVFAAAVILGERAGRGLIVLLVLVTGGLFFVAQPDLSTAGAPGAGDLLVLASAATGAVYAALCRRLVASVAPLPLSILQQMAGLLAVLGSVGAATLAGRAPFGLTTLSSTGLALAVLSGLLQHGAAVWLHLHALKRMPAGTFALFLALVPMFALLGANLALSEQISPAQLVGGALILAATIVAGGMTRCAAPSLAKEIYDEG